MKDKKKRTFKAIEFINRSVLNEFFGYNRTSYSAANEYKKKEDREAFNRLQYYIELWKDEQKQKALQSADVFKLTQLWRGTKVDILTGDAAGKTGEVDHYMQTTAGIVLAIVKVKGFPDQSLKQNEFRSILFQ